MNHQKTHKFIPCRQCGAQLYRSTSGLVCFECDAKIIPAGEISLYYESYSDRDVEQLPEHTCNSTEEICRGFTLIKRLNSGKLTEKQRQKLLEQQDRQFQRMTYRRMKIENEQRRQRRMLFDGEEPKEFEFQPTLF
jgi:hypothetical protein